MIRLYQNQFLLIYMLVPAEGGGDGQLTAGQGGAGEGGGPLGGGQLGGGQVDDVLC